MWQSNGMEQIRIDEEMARHSAKNNTMSRHYANDDSRVLMYDLMKPSDPALNRLSAPVCGGLKKNPLSNSLTDLCEGTHVHASCLSYVTLQIPNTITLNAMID